MGCSCMTRMLFGVVLASAVFLVIIPMTILSFNNDCSSSMVSQQCGRNTQQNVIAGNIRSSDDQFHTEGGTSSQSMSSGTKPQTGHIYTGDKRFIFHRGKLSVGGDITEPSATLHISTQPNNVEYLKSLCDQTPGCVGFSSDGILKRMIRPFDNWTHASPAGSNGSMKEEGTATYHGLYTMDINYCDSTEYHYCPKGTNCVNKMNGTYICQPLVKINRNEVQLVVSVDTVLLPGLLALLQSIKVNCKRRTKIVIHIVVNTTDRQHVEDEVACSLNIPSNIKLRYKTFNVPEDFKELIRVESHTYLKSTANFARFFFADMFPTLSHVLYLDVDTIVMHDLDELWKQVVNDNNKLLVAVRRKFPRYRIHFPYGNLTSLFLTRYNQTLDLSSSTFNAGVLGFNLHKWRKNRVTNDVIYWMEKNAITPLWFQGTQPILYIIAYNDWKAVDEQWNVEGLGWTRVSVKAVSKAHILHWNGPDKPWGKMDMMNAKKKSVRKLTGQFNVKWLKYKRVKCSGKGVCSPQDDQIAQTTPQQARCVCNSGYEGLLCERRYGK